MMNKYFLHGKLKAKVGQGDQLAGILLKASDLVSTSKGCRLYIVSKDNNDPDAVWITEVWDTKQDHDDSLKNDSVRALIMKAMPLLDGQPEKGQQLEMIGGFGA